MLVGYHSREVVVVRRRRWWARRSAASPARQGAEPRCPGEGGAEVVDLIDLARPPLKLVPLENLLPPSARTGPDATVLPLIRNVSRSD